MMPGPYWLIMLSALRASPRHLSHLFRFELVSLPDEPGRKAGYP